MTTGYRHYSTDLPMLKVYNFAGTTVERTIRFSEEDNQIISMPRAGCTWARVDDVPVIVTHDKTRHEQPKGYQLQATIVFRIFEPQLSALPDSRQESWAFTERDAWFLMKARLSSAFRIFYYPHQSRDFGVDTRFEVDVDIVPSQADGKTCKSEWTLDVIGRYVTANPPDEF